MHRGGRILTYDRSLREERVVHSTTRSRIAPLLLTLLVGLAACGAPDATPSTMSTSTTPVQLPTSSLAPTTTSSTAVTTTRGVSTASTTLFPSWHGPEPCSDCAAYEVVATVPVLPCDEPVTGGFAGIAPECRGDSPFFGPKAMIVDQDGVFWIADVLRFERVRLIRVDPVEDAIDVIEIPEDVISVLDIAAIPGGLALVWVDAFGHAFIEIVDESGVSRSRTTLDPVDFGGFEGLALATVGDRLYLERGFGLHAALVQIPGSPGEILRGYDTPYGFYSTSPIRTPEATIPYQVEGSVGTVTLVGVNPDGSLVVMVDDVSQSPSNEILVDQEVLWYRRDGTLIGKIEFPLDQQVVPIGQPVCLSGDGYIYGLLTRTDHADIVRFNFTPGT